MKRWSRLWPLALAALALLVWRLLPGAGAFEEQLSALASTGPLSGRELWRVSALLAAATLVSEDLTCLAAGALVARGALPLVPASAACFLGILAGDVLLFLAGRWFGRPLLARAPLRWFLDQERVDEAARWLERRGAIVILTSRFLPGARLPTYFASGALGTGLARFTLWFALAGLLWTPALVALAAGIGGGFGRWSKTPLGVRLDAGAAWSLFGSIALCWLVLSLARSLSTWRGRALWRMRIRRLTRFEYWPIGVFYLPVFGLFLARALRGRGLVFTAANPGLPHGGFVGESKGAIYARLAAAGAPLPHHVVLEVAPGLGARREAALRFLEQHRLAYPLVVKPDAGQRGEGVRIVRDAAQLEAALEESSEALILQEFVPGSEYGLFYARAPGAAVGRLVSITRKLLPEVVGDGTHALEHLILAHPEHLPMARFFLEAHATELARVPTAGERVRLGELGTHCRGARFLDGSALATPALAAELERIASATPGFCFGRFDVRAASDAALGAGRFAILEWNGVTAEAAHIYDPACGLWAAWSSLLAQWRLAYAIGEENVRRGARASSMGELWTALREYRALATRRASARRAARPSVRPRGTLAEARS